MKNLIISDLLTPKGKETNVHISPNIYPQKLNRSLRNLDILANTLSILVQSQSAPEGPTRFSVGKLFGRV